MGVWGTISLFFTTLYGGTREAKKVIQQSLGMLSAPQRLNPHATELIALDTSVSHLLASVQGGGVTPPITIFSDCKSALQALNNPYPRSGYT